MVAAATSCPATAYVFRDHSPALEYLRLTVGVFRNEHPKLVVDTAHRASLLYSFAALLLGRFSALNELSARTNVFAVSAPLIFFALAIGSYILHGALGDTSNQIAKPRLGRRALPVWATPLFMVSLVAAEIGGFVVLLVGFVQSAYR